MFLIGYFQSTIRPVYALTLCLMRGCVLSIIFVKISTDLFRSERNLDFCPACRTIHTTYWNPAVEKSRWLRKANLIPSAF